MAQESGIEFIGAAQLHSSLNTAAAKMQNLDATSAAREIAARAAHTAPRRTGRLASSVRAQGQGTITSPLVYAVPIHWGRPAHNIRANPFIMRAADQSEHEWTAAAEKDAQHILDGVHGA